MVETCGGMFIQNCFAPLWNRLRKHYMTIRRSSAASSLSGHSRSRWALCRFPTWCTTSLSISQIAERLHFSYTSSFGKFFSRKKGVTPKDFRRYRASSDTVWCRFWLGLLYLLDYTKASMPSQMEGTDAFDYVHWSDEKQCVKRQESRAGTYACPYTNLESSRHPRGRMVGVSFHSSYGIDSLLQFI